MDNKVIIEAFFVEGCASRQPVMSLIHRVVEELGLPAKVETLIVNSPEEAARLRLPGSPTVRVNGKDVEPGVTEGHFGTG